MVITLEEVKAYARIDIDDDDRLLGTLIAAAEEYLRNATGKEYPETDADGNRMNYELEKIFLQMLIAHWYERRNPVGNGKGAEDLGFAAKAVLLQLQLK